MRLPAGKHIRSPARMPLLGLRPLPFHAHDQDLCMFDPFNSVKICENVLASEWAQPISALLFKLQGILCSLGQVQIDFPSCVHRSDLLPWNNSWHGSRQPVWAPWAAEVFLASLRPRLLSFFLEFDGVRAIQFMKLHEGATSMVNLSECRWEI